MPLIRLDLHMHSDYSRDSSTTLERLVARAREVGLDRIALTDHNTAEGALELRKLAPDLAIVGEEIKTREGEIIALFIRDTIAWGGRPEDALDTIHDMGGVACLAHPFDRWRANFNPHRVAELAPRIDLIEVHNQWASAEANAAAARLARELGIPGTAGSDAHSPAELGHSWIEIEEFDGPAEFLANMRTARLVVHDTSGQARRA